MFWIDLGGALLTLAAVGLLVCGGYLAALRLLREEALRDPLALAVASLLLATAEAVGIGLLLGGFGVLRIGYALALQAGLVLLLLPGTGKLEPARAVFRRSWEILREHPALALVTVHAIGSEALRGLLRPPLAWDSLMYHLLLTGTWLRDGNLDPVFGNIPVNYYGYVPANGSVWYWWWMAPSHSEFWVNLAALPHWVLLGLAAGAVARELGAKRHWPFASFLVLLTPTVIRFAATQYVDIFVGAALLSATLFALRWLRTPREPAWRYALLAGTGLGLAAGAKVLGIPYAMALAGGTVLLSRRPWGRRVPQLLAALAVAALLGSFFYVRNMALGADPLALACEQTASGKENANQPTIPRKNSVIDLSHKMFVEGQLLEAFLGVDVPQFVELGLGPQAFVLLLAALALPFALGRERWRESLMVSVQVWAQLAFWLAVPFAKASHVFANIRYLIPALGLSFAGAVAIGERRGVRDRWMEGISLALLLQGLLQLNPRMPLGVRIAIAFVDLAAVALALSPRLRDFTVRRRRGLALATLALALLGAPFLARFRVRDRDRALAHEYTAHQTTIRYQAPGWAWLDRHGGSGNVAAVHSPNNYFMYPAMGPRLERDVRYVNLNRADRRSAVAYPQCQPRVDPSAEAWVANLSRMRIRWVHLSRYPLVRFTVEKDWAEARPRDFALRYSDDTNRIYELIPGRNGMDPARSTARGNGPAQETREAEDRP
ncbi:MAG TPA: hypothetical protein VHC97_22680 [Thermoanaerobaculia bacterium]|jgi:4-amino-4-deoxy-L-arabinose transferase-like glycosyltransferase|nr:hypothetical protein [Thermoanaerobaculia bacterium]